MPLHKCFYISIFFVTEIKATTQMPQSLKRSNNLRKSQTGETCVGGGGGGGRYSLYAMAGQKCCFAHNFSVLCKQVQFCSKQLYPVNGQYRKLNVIVRQPKHVKHYHAYMEGVDKSDQLINKFYTLRKTNVK